MKKLMFVAAVALAGAAFAEGEIVSANVVGYQEVATPQGISMRAATFKAIGGDYKISDIKVAGAVGVGGEYGQVVNADGSWGQQYYFLVEEEAGCPTGWYKDMAGGEPVGDTDVLTVGQAFFFSSDSDLTFTYSGEVNGKDSVISAPAGICMFGNPTPVVVKFSDIAVTGAVGVGGEYGQKVLADGSWGQVYYFLVEEEAGCPTGWYKDMAGGEPVADTDVLEPGESLFFSTDSDLTVTIPSALK